MEPTSKLTIDWLVTLSLLTFFSQFLLIKAMETKGVPCTAGYGITEASDDLLEFDENGGCNFLDGEVPFGNTCKKLLERGLCKRGEWLIIDDDSEILKCQRRKCANDQVMFDDTCVFLNDTTQCDETFELIINQHGEGDCECPPGHLYHDSTDKCYVPYTRGPCDKNEIIKMKIDDNTGIGTCESNPCPKEKMTPLNSRCLPQDDTSDARCYTIGKQRPCKGGSYLLIEPTLARPFCLAQKPNSIVPRLVKRAIGYNVNYLASNVRKCQKKYQRGPCIGSGYYYRGSCISTVCTQTSMEN